VSRVLCLIQTKIHVQFGIEINKAPDSLLQLIGLAKIRATTLNDLVLMLEYYFASPSEYEEKGVTKYFYSGSGAEYLAELYTLLETIEPFNEARTEVVIRRYAESKEVGAGKVIHPLRLALTGRTASPGIFEILEILGKEEVLKRIRKALSFINSEVYDQKQ